MEHLTTDVAVKLLDDIVAEFGAEITYKDRYRIVTGKQFTGPGASCRYRTDDRSEPLCILGVLFDRLEIEVDESSGPDTILDAAGITSSDKALSLLIDAQSGQDMGFSWGESVERAKERYL